MGRDEMDERLRRDHSDEIETPAAAAQPLERLMVEAHITVRQPRGARVLAIDEVVGVKLDATGEAGESDHGVYVSRVHLRPARVRDTDGRLGRALRGDVEVTYSLTTLRWSPRADEQAG